MKFVRKYGNYYSDNGKYMIERDKYQGWNLYEKTENSVMTYNRHVINCDTLSKCKAYAK